MGGAFVNARADRDAFFFITSHSLSVDVSLERSVTLVRYLSFDVRGDERAFSFLALSAPRSSWSTSTLGCGSRRGRRACSCTRGRTPGCWPQRRPCRRCGSCGSGTPCGKRCGGELEASSEGKRESGGREIFVRRVDAPVRLGDLFVGSCLEDGRAGLFFLLGHACSRVRGSGAVRVRRACSEEPKTSSPGVFRSSRCRIEKRRQRRRRSRQIRWRKVDQPLAAHPFRGFDDRVRWLRRPTQTVTTS